MVAILAMAALSIDLVVLYLAREEAQRSADAAALTAARVFSISGITGDPDNSTPYRQQICGGFNSAATQAEAEAGRRSPPKR
jgi:Flp pilus assembly protein TadG